MQPTSEKRDFVIKELLDTEKNYVQVLAKLKRNFMKPLCKQMKPEDHERVFYKISVIYFFFKCDNIIDYLIIFIFLGIARYSF